MRYGFFGVNDEATIEFDQCSVATHNTALAHFKTMAGIVIPVHL